MFVDQTNIYYNYYYYKNRNQKTIFSFNIPKWIIVNFAILLSHIQELVTVVHNGLGIGAGSPPTSEVRQSARHKALLIYK